MTLGEQLTDYVHAAFSGLWIQTPEAEEAEREITRHAAERGWKLAVWDIAQGIRLPSAQEKAGAQADAHDPVAAVHHSSAAKIRRYRDLDMLERDPRREL